MKKLLNKISIRTQKIILIVLGSILVILIITNPSNSRFKEYLNSQGFKTDIDKNSEEGYYSVCSYGKENNYFIFSYYRYTYRTKSMNEEGDKLEKEIEPDITKKYFGIFGNFIEIR